MFVRAKGIPATRAGLGASTDAYGPAPAQNASHAVTRMAALPARYTGNGVRRPRTAKASNITSKAHQMRKAKYQRMPARPNVAAITARPPARAARRGERDVDRVRMSAPRP